MPLAQLAVSHYEPDGLGEAPKFCVNMYPEKGKSDAARELKLVATPGSLDCDTGNAISGTVRGLAQADGHASGNILVVDGTTVRTFNPSTKAWGTLTGTLTGTDRTQSAFSEVQGALLSDGDIYVSTGTSVAAASDGDWTTLLSDHGQSGFTSVATLGQRLLVTYGSRFAYSTSLEFNTTTTLSWYTAESSPDGVVAGVVSGEIYWLFGTETIEPWVRTGVNDDPYQRLQGRVIPRGCAGRDTIVKMSETLYFVADDRSVRVLFNQSAVKISPSWVDRLLRNVDASTLICKSYETEGHAFYCINAPGFCVVFDAEWSKIVGPEDAWHVRTSRNSATWDWAHILDVDGKQYAAQRSGSRFVDLSRDYWSDYEATAGTSNEEIQRSFSAHLPVLSGRAVVPSIRLDGSHGIGLATGQGEDPQVSMSLSKDNGQTFGNKRQRGMGKIGDYLARTIWRQNGRSREPQVIAKFEMSDPVPWIVSAVFVGGD